MYVYDFYWDVNLLFYVLSIVVIEVVLNGVVCFCFVIFIVIVGVIIFVKIGDGF